MCVCVCARAHVCSGGRGDVSACLGQMAGLCWRLKEGETSMSWTSQSGLLHGFQHGWKHTCSMVCVCVCEREGELSTYTYKNI